MISRLHCRCERGKTQCRVCFKLDLFYWFHAAIGQCVLAEHERRSQFLFICLHEVINWATGTLFDKNVNWIERDMSYDPPPSLFGELLTSPAFWPGQNFHYKLLYCQIFICIPNLPLLFAARLIFLWFCEWIYFTQRLFFIYMQEKAVT